NYRKFREGEIHDVNRHHLREGAYQNTADFRFEGFYRYGHLAYNWGKLYRREFLVKNNLWSKSYPFTQDKAHNMLCYAYRPKYAFIDQSVYLYRENQESVTFRYKPNMREVWTDIAKDFHEELKDRGVYDDYYDITAFHVLFGSFFLVKQELLAQHGLKGAKEALREYGEDPFVRESITALAKGKYLRGVANFAWRLAMRIAAILFAWKAYALLTFGIASLRFLRIDAKISEKRNKLNKSEKKRAAKTEVSREVRALCRLLKTALTKPKEEMVRLAYLDDISFDSVLTMAGQHKVLPMLYDILEEYLEEHGRTDELRSLQQTTEATVKQSYRLLFLTKELTDLISGAGIPVVALKGCGIAAYYPVPEYRKSGDIDLLLRSPDEVMAAGMLLQSKGYELKEEQHANHHMAYQGREGIDIELHAMLAEPFDDGKINKKIEELLPQYFEGMRKTDSMGVMIPTAPEALQALELLLHMLQHFLRAGFGLKLLADWVVFWNRVNDRGVAYRFVSLAEECGVTGFAKAITLVCEKYLGLSEIQIFGRGLEAEFSRGYAEHFLIEIINAEEFGKADKNRMVALRNKSLGGYLKEFHYQMKMNYAEESKHKWKWPWLWCKTFFGFLRNNKRLGRGNLRSILKSAGERAGVVEEMRLFK
ncbi:MAG: nucleotidyltransferase family protein, partial [Lachnospiraceae bacterium]|nr:nucleotidyltransferase family protein [Lachnospiraceae bacterium]